MPFGKQYEVLPCPFCYKGEIQCLHFPNVWSEKRSKTATFGSTRRVTKSSEEWIIQSSCLVCGKSVEEVEKEFRKKEII